MTNEGEKRKTEFLSSLTKKNSPPLTGRRVDRKKKPTPPPKGKKERKRLP